MVWVVAGRISVAASNFQLAVNLRVPDWGHASRNRRFVANVLSPTIPRRYSSPKFTRPGPPRGRVSTPKTTGRPDVLGPTKTIRGNLYLNGFLCGLMPAAVAQTAGRHSECKHRNDYSTVRISWESRWRLTGIPDVPIFLQETYRTMPTKFFDLV
jgi:hypothetical protein